jgi:hypothetical protein
MATRDQIEPDLSTYDGPHAVNLGSLWQRGMTAFCVCGWHPKNHPGFIVADHLRDMESSHESPSAGA